MNICKPYPRHIVKLENRRRGFIDVPFQEIPPQDKHDGSGPDCEESPVTLETETT